MTKGVIGADVWPLFDLFIPSILPEFVISDLRPVVRDPTVLAGSGNTGNVIRHQPSLSHFSVSYCPVPCMYPPIHDCILYSIYFYLCKFIIFVTSLLCSFLFIHFHTMFMPCMCMCRHIYLHTKFRYVFPCSYNPILCSHTPILCFILCLCGVCVCADIYIFILCSAMFSLFIQSHIMFTYPLCFLVTLYVHCM